MTSKWNGIERRKTLRAEAELVVAGLSPKDTVIQPVEMLIHELLVHKVELEMQNEELRLAHTALEDARNRYVDFYEFAPVGYIAVDREGVILQTNLTASALLGIDRSKLINCRFSQFVATEERDRWYRFFLNIMELNNADRHGFALAMSRYDGTPFHGYLGCLLRVSAEAPPELRIALTDVSSFTFPGEL